MKTTALLLSFGLAGSLIGCGGGDDNDTDTVNAVKFQRSLSASGEAQFYPLMTEAKAVDLFIKSYDAQGCEPRSTYKDLWPSVGGVRHPIGYVFTKEAGTTCVIVVDDNGRESKPRAIDFAALASTVLKFTRSENPSGETVFSPVMTQPMFANLLTKPFDAQGCQPRSEYKYLWPASGPRPAIGYGFTKEAGAVCFISVDSKGQESEPVLVDFSVMAAHKAEN